MRQDCAHRAKLARHLQTRQETLDRALGLFAFVLAHRNARRTDAVLGSRCARIELVALAIADPEVVEGEVGVEELAEVVLQRRTALVQESGTQHAEDGRTGWPADRRHGLGVCARCRRDAGKGDQCAGQSGRVSSTPVRLRDRLALNEVEGERAQIDRRKRELDHVEHASIGRPQAGARCPQRCAQRHQGAVGGRGARDSRTQPVDVHERRHRRPLGVQRVESGQLILLTPNVGARRQRREAGIDLGQVAANDLRVRTVATALAVAVPIQEC